MPSNPHAADIPTPLTEPTPATLQRVPLLRFANVVKEYTTQGARVRALNDLTLDVNAGSFLALVGRSGCGKSTLLKIMAGLDQPIRNLSGGNQQKVVFARWVMAGSTVLLLDEPTRGVDVGAKVEIYELINEITENGGAVVMVSSELPEVLGMSDRILVMSNGQVAGILDADGATEDAVMSLAVSAVTSAVTSTKDDPAPTSEAS